MVAVTRRQPYKRHMSYTFQKLKQSATKVNGAWISLYSGTIWHWMKFIWCFILQYYDKMEKEKGREQELDEKKKHFFFQLCSSRVLFLHFVVVFFPLSFLYIYVYIFAPSVYTTFGWVHVIRVFVHYSNVFKKGGLVVELGSLYIYWDRCYHTFHTIDTAKCKFINSIWSGFCLVSIQYRMRNG